VLALLRSPGTLNPLKQNSEAELRSDSGETFPIMDGILCLLNPDERNVDLGDGGFYDRNPFGERNWRDRADLESGVENELKGVLGKLSPSAMIGDIGSGPGRISNYLSVAGFTNVVSLDYSLPSLKQTRANSANVCIWGNNLHLPIAAGSFDLVISSGVVHHTPDPYKAIAECIRVLKPGGTFYLRVYNIASPYGVLYKTYGAILRLFAKSSATRWLSDLLGFKVYKFVRSAIFRMPAREDRVLAAKFGNLFMKDLVYFFSTSEIRGLLQQHGIKILSGQAKGKTHRMHCYVGQKQA
jgi:SAM-dependent methyltransferase